MKGIILAGGSGTRLYPLTYATSKQLLPIYDKPMIYYPLSILMNAGIKDILIISTPIDLPKMKRLLGDGSRLGIKLQYIEQPSPDGIAQAFLLGEEFIGDDAVAMVLGDNIFYGSELKKHLIDAENKANNDNIATIFTYYVNDPERFGIVETDKDNNILSIEEKPSNPKSHYCVTGLYFYPKGVSQYAKKIELSQRNELEITDLNNVYLKENRLVANKLGKEYYWLDVGTTESLFNGSNYIKQLYDKGIYVGYIEETAFDNGWISKESLIEQATSMGNTKYAQHLLDITK